MSNSVLTLLKQRRVWLAKAVKSEEAHKATELARMAAEIIYYSQMLPCQQHGPQCMHHHESEVLRLACEQYLEMYNKTKNKSVKEHED